jgi:uncharacterized SAM-binding protein YcdF (DUF218 family)
MAYIEPCFPVLVVLTVACVLFGIQGWRRRLAIASAIALFAFSWPPASWLGAWIYEKPYPAEPPRDRNVQAIVVLTSLVEPLPIAILGFDSYERSAYAAWLYRNWVAVPLLASGGDSIGNTPYSVVLKDALARDGVPLPMIWTEERSHSTYESAIFSAEILRRKGIHKIALVTEAYHMARAERCFRKQGLEVLPAAFQFRAHLRSNWESFLPSWQAVAWNEDVFHESIGLVWYFFRGRI